jgi:carbamoyltransferase
MVERAGDLVLGVSADYHDSAAALVLDGVPVLAVEEERFSRVKHDPALPQHAIRWVLEEWGVQPGDLSSVAFYSKPFTMYDRVLSSLGAAGPRALPALARAVSTWGRRKLWVEYRLDRVLSGLGLPLPPVVYAEHHQSHAASAFFVSPFDSAAVLTSDGVGEWATSSIAVGEGARLELIRQMLYPDSVGLFYSAMTAYCGFEVNDGEYKLMGLAPFGAPRFRRVMEDHLIRLHADGSVHLGRKWFRLGSAQSMLRPGVADFLGGPARRPHEPLTDREADIARSAQDLLEEAMLRTARHAFELTGQRRACLAGGVALNCVANRRILEDGPFDDIWVQPAAGDGGGSLGAALWAHHVVLGRPRVVDPLDRMSGALLGPAYSTAEIAAWLDRNGVRYERFEDLDRLCGLVAAGLSTGAVVGWFRGRMEFGPRALGGRSILADPRDSAMIARINASVKGREGFRPFGPAVLAERAAEWFDLDRPSPYMLRTAEVRSAVPVAAGGGPFEERIAAGGSALPACTHVDGSARVQTVDHERFPDFHRLLTAFEQQTGVPVLLNTSFNVRGEPIVRTPADALRCFRRAGLDLLVLEDCLVTAAGSSEVR